MPVEIAAEQKYVSFLSNKLLGGSSRKMWEKWVHDTMYMKIIKENNELAGSQHSLCT